MVEDFGEKLRNPFPMLVVLDFHNIPETYYETGSPLQYK